MKDVGVPAAHGFDIRADPPTRPRSHGHPAWGAGPEDGGGDRPGAPGLGPAAAAL